MKRIAAISLLLLCTMLSPDFGQAQTPEGRWVTIDDKTDAEKSIVEIYLEGEKLYGRVVEILQVDEGAPRNADGQIICTRCDGERHNQPVEGMVILWDMERDGDEWSGGRIMDPENGKTYRSKIWLDEGNLRVRGYLGPFYRTQTWLPAGDG